MPSMSEPKPMQLGNMCFSTREQERCWRKRLCLFYGNARHLISQCLSCQSSQSGHAIHGGAYKPWLTSVNTASYVSIPSYIIKAQILHLDRPFVIRAMIGSCSAGNFIDHHTALKLQLPLRCLNKPLQINSIDDSLVWGGTIQLCTAPIILQVSSLRFEEISLLVTNTPEHPIILGIPWLQLHNPQISRRQCEMTK